MMNPLPKIRFTPEVTQYVRMGINSYRGKLMVQLSFWGAAIAVGVAAVLFAKLITWVQTLYGQWFMTHPYLTSAITPFAFVASVAVVRYLAPFAGGSGVPQVLYATHLVHDNSNLDDVERKMVSVRTSAVKVLSTCLGFAGGASIGGEGPTVQIAASIFATFGHRMKRFFPKLDFHSYLVAAAGAGIGAAFNTPLGGVAFALEEFALGDFGPLRHMVLLGVIVSGLTAQAIVGDDLYFGRPDLRFAGFGITSWAIVIGVSGGVMGGLFGRIVTWQGWDRLKISWWVRAAGFGTAVAVLGLLFEGQTGGSGYTLTRDMLNGVGGTQPILFPLAKLLATSFSTLSGMGGGILAPSLSIGAWTGVSVGKIAAFSDLKVCGLLGMTAYFTGAFQIPITAIIVVMEMTDEHDLILPMMIAALCAFLIARLIMPVSLYHVLIERWSEKTVRPSKT